MKENPRAEDFSAVRHFTLVVKTDSSQFQIKSNAREFLERGRKRAPSLNLQFRQLKGDQFHGHLEDNWN
jgi:hypothetical protein